MQADVSALMQGELGAWLKQQSAMREAAKEDAQSRWIWGYGALLPILAFIWIAGIDFAGFKSILTFGGLVGVGLWGYQPIAEAKKTIKIGINTAIANSIGIQYQHHVLPGGEFEACKTYGLVPSHDRDEFEDRWFGNLGGHGFELYEAHLEERQGSGKNQRYVTVFKGAIISMEFGREFRSTTLLQRAGKHKKWLGLGGRKDSVKFRGHELAYVDQVHPAFEDVFEVWSDDQVEARVLVHPSYVEHMLALERAFGGKAIRALFAQGSVVIAVESGNLFESGSLDTFGDEERVAEAAEQFTALANLGLAINQNERGRVMTSPPPRDPNMLFGRRRQIRR